MACFLVSVAEALVVTAFEKSSERKEARALEVQAERGETKTAPSEESIKKVPMSRKLKILTYMLWGGAILLCYEHVWHGEVVPWFPFLTAMSSPADTAAMLHEMATIGVSMALLITIIWLIMCKVLDAILARRTESRIPASDAE